MEKEDENGRQVSRLQLGNSLRIILGECNYYKNGCAGCGYVKGKPFWGECRFYSCVREKGVEHCGLCAEFPCDYYLTTFDPKEGQSRVS